MEKQSTSNTYLTFKLGKEQFAINVAQVISILETHEITVIPNSPNYLSGIINLRGEVIPVIDTRIRFGMEATTISTNTSIIILEIETETTKIKAGAFVDSVNEVMNCNDDEIQPVPNIGTKYHTNYLLGMIQLDIGFIMILNANKVFAFTEALQIANTEITQL